jgi:hypothetical protein
MAKTPKAPAPEIDDRLAIDAAPAQIDRARAHLTTRLRRMVLESIYSANDPGAIYRTVRDIQALDMLRPTQSDAKIAPAPAVVSVEDAAQAQREAHDAHKAEEARKAARGT